MTVSSKLTVPSRVACWHPPQAVSQLWRTCCCTCPGANGIRPATLTLHLSSNTPGNTGLDQQRSNDGFAGHKAARRGRPRHPDAGRRVGRGLERNRRIPLQPTTLCAGPRGHEAHERIERAHRRPQGPRRRDRQERRPCRRQEPYPPRSSAGRHRGPFLTIFPPRGGCWQASRPSYCSPGCRAQRLHACSCPRVRQV